jgi:hypothetical protein
LLYPRPMNLFARLAPLPLVLAASACADLSTQVVCSGVARPSLVVDAVDAATGLSVSAEAAGSWSSGTFSDSLRHVQTGDGGVRLAAYGPAGIYQVRVSRPGFADWTRAGVEVQQDVCGPRVVNLTATHGTLQ